VGFGRPVPYADRANLSVSFPQAHRRLAREHLKLRTIGILLDPRPRFYRLARVLPPRRDNEFMNILPQPLR
jgi:hypothetical protein